MPQFTRRSLIQQTAIATSFATLAPAINPAATDTATASVFHVFAFQWNPNATEAQKQKAATDIAAFQGQIPGLLQTHVGPNVSPRGKGYTFGGIMQFKDQAALDAYVQHPSHQALLAWLVPLIDAIELDLRA
jgi:antibiotic biosynthesis monooxygenase (ABM) superfamily enzyme